MTAPINWGGQHLGQFGNTTAAVAGNLFGVRRVLAAALNVNVNSATTDWQVPLGYISNFTGATANASGTASPPTA